MEKFAKIFFIIVVSIIFGYFWAYKAYTPQINQLKQQIVILEKLAVHK